MSITVQKVISNPLKDQPRFYGEHFTGNQLSFLPKPFLKSNYPAADRQNVKR
jgi:hypothetical protein